jgi:hypothetical protein
MRSGTPAGLVVKISRPGFEPGPGASEAPMQSRVVKKLERCSSLMRTCVLQILTRADLGRAETWSNGFGPVVRFQLPSMGWPAQSKGEVIR